MVESATLRLPDARTAMESLATWAAEDAEVKALLATQPAAQAASRWGLHLLRANRNADAATALRVAVALAPEHAPAWTNLGVALDRAGAHAEAAASLERSLSIARAQPDTWLLLGLVRKKGGDIEGAARAYEVALQQEPRSVAAWQCLGLLREQRRDYEGAAACFRSSVEYGDLRAATHANLGKLYFQLGRVADSDDAYGAAVRADSANAHYRLMLRRVSFVRAVLEGSGVDRALDAYSDGQGADGTVSGAAVGDLLEMAIGLLTAYGHVEAARRVARARVARFPASAAAKYIASALESTPGIDRSPHDYIVETFDAFADAFDAKLVDVLGYDVPEKIDALVRRAVRPSRDVCDALDAGCGTGLVGPLVRSLCRSLTGVDLSPRMLEHAAKRGAYDTLVCEDLVAFLNRSPAAFDLAVAADVLIYFGDLAPVLGAFATALRPGGLLAISFEVHDGAGYKLSPSGRFAHATQFVTELAAGAFTAEATERTTIRLEGAARVPGRLLLLRRS